MDTSDENSATADAEKEKEVAYYSSLVSGWMETRMERDKSLLGLSSGGIGLLVTLFTTVGTVSPVTLFFYAFATVAFCGTIFCSLTILYRNADYVESILENNGSVENQLEGELERLDWWNFWTFAAGVLSTVAVAGSSVIVG